MGRVEREYSVRKMEWEKGRAKGVMILVNQRAGLQLLWQ